jgi:hypothetical protein
VSIPVEAFVGIMTQMQNLEIPETILLENIAAYVIWN